MMFGLGMLGSDRKLLEQRFTPRILELPFCSCSAAPGNHFVSFSDPLFNDVQFEDVSNSRKAYCWKYFLYANVKPNQKAKCRVEMSKGEFCNRVLISSGGSKEVHIKRFHSK